MRTTHLLIVPGVLIAFAVAFLWHVPAGAAPAGAGGPGDFEVWLIDQADTTADGGGTLYIYDGTTLATAGATSRPEVIDLGGAARSLCLEQTGSAPRRPHMVLMNPSYSHAVLAWVATGHVLFMDAASRTPVACIDVGEQAHAAFPTPDERHVIVANQNGKLLQRIRTEYASNTFVLEDAATLDLAGCRTPSGAPCQDATLRPDNAPICPVIDSRSRWGFVTLRGGGLFVVDLAATPMAIVAEYDRATVAPNGCGGVETAGRMYINSGGGTAGTPFNADLYAFSLSEFSASPSAVNTPTPTLVFRQEGRVDSHGAAVVADGAAMWFADRAANTIVVVDPATNQVTGEIALVGPLSDDPAPDLIAVAPNGEWAFLSLRGPNPLTANVPEVGNAVGSTPGVAVVSIGPGGRSGQVVAVARVSRMVDGSERADPHAIAVRPK
jgi:DNA-binding beta-propeller fold protein YncE